MSVVPPWLTFALSLSVLGLLGMVGSWAVFSWMFKYKVAARYQVDHGRPPQRELFRRCAREAFTGNVPFAIVLATVVYPLWTWRGGRVDWTWPPVTQLMFHVVVFAVINETVFYFYHRALHRPWLYRHVHARHHQFTRTRVPVAFYSHPLEAVPGLVGFMIGPILFGTPMITFAVWVFLHVVEACEAHSGYALTSGGSKHAFHHLNPHGGCYGTGLAIWDTLLRTDHEWRALRAAPQSRSQNRSVAAPEP